MLFKFWCLKLVVPIRLQNNHMYTWQFFAHITWQFSILSINLSRFVKSSFWMCRRGARAQRVWGQSHCGWFAGPACSMYFTALKLYRAVDTSRTKSEAVHGYEGLGTRLTRYNTDVTRQLTDTHITWQHYVTKVGFVIHWSHERWHSSGSQTVYLPPLYEVRGTKWHNLLLIAATNKPWEKQQYDSALQTTKITSTVISYFPWCTVSVCEGRM